MNAANILFNDTNLKLKHISHVKEVRSIGTLLELTAVNEFKFSTANKLIKSELSKYRFFHLN